MDEAGVDNIAGIDDVVDMSDDVDTNRADGASEPAGSTKLKDFDDVTGVILAGGASSRFGADKALHHVGGQAMIARVHAAIATVTPNVLVSLGMDSPPYDLPGVRFVRDRYVDAGPLAGLHAALAAADTPWLLAVACDMPYLTSDALRRLLAERTSSVEIVVAREESGRLQPLCACYHKALLPRVEAELNAGRRAVHGLIRRLKHVEVPFPQDRTLQNVNTASDLTPPPRTLPKSTLPPRSAPSAQQNQSPKPE